MKNYKFRIIIFVFLLAAVSKLHSSDIMTSADRNTGKGIDFAVYWLQEKRDIDINASSLEEISVLNLDSTVSTFSYVSKSREKYKLKEEEFMPVIKFTMRLGEKFHPYVKFGISKTELSGYGNKWESRQDCLAAGFGLKYVLLQDTVVSPAFSVDAGATFNDTKIKKFDGTDTDLNYKTHEIAASFWTSKKLKKFEPYLGVQMSFVNGKFENYGVDADSVNVFYGCSFKILPDIRVAVENSFIDMKNFNFSAGINVTI